MAIDILFFGQLSDITGTAQLSLDGVADTDMVVQHLQQQYPALATAKFVVAVNKNVIQQNTEITDGSIIALLPPFSGG
jgi:sulfur-carrier protein